MYNFSSNIITWLVHFLKIHILDTMKFTILSTAALLSSAYGFGVTVSILIFHELSTGMTIFEMDVLSDKIKSLQSYFCIPLVLCSQTCSPWNERRTVRYWRYTFFLNVVIFIWIWETWISKWWNYYYDDDDVSWQC